MVNTYRKGNRVRAKVKAWLEAKGYHVEVVEYRSQYRTGDLWGADLLASDGDEELIAVQVKSNKADMARGERELTAGPWPVWVKRWVVCWPNRYRDPEVRIC